MFSNLSQKLLSIFDKVRNRGLLSDEIIESTIKEIRFSLIEADVALSVVKSFVADIKLKLKDQQVIKSVTPEQTIIKIVYDELVKLLGANDINFNKNSIMLVGLQGSGKTTTAAKLAKFLNNNCLLVPLDTYRPAAIEQLKKLALANNIAFFDKFNLGDSPTVIAKKAQSLASQYNTVIYDTAGRLYLDNNMMDELIQIKSIVNPAEILLVLDSMMGQDALNTAKEFNEKLSLTGLVMTRIDGDSRGGAALSAKYITGCQIKFIGTGEKIKDIELFHPERVASRILDKGDIVSLVEKAIDENIVEDVSKVKIGKDFDLNGMEQYLKQIEKIGGMSGIMKFLPGVRQLQKQLKDNNISDKLISKQIAIIRSMTPKERKNIKILDASRKKRIAKGCGQDVADINKLIKQFEQMKSFMLKMTEGGFMNGIFNSFKK